MKRICLLLCITLPTVLMYSCKNDGHPHSHEDEEVSHEPQNSSRVTLSAEQIKSIGVELGKLEKKQLTASLKANGILKVPNQNRANVTVSLGGTVENILVQAGSTVSKGQVLVTLSNREFITLQEEYLSTAAKASLAQEEFERQKTLREGNAASQKSFQQADAELKSLQAKKSSLEKQLKLIGINYTRLSAENLQSDINITSPINGSVSDVLVNIGTYAEANNTLAEIVDNSQLHLDLYVYEKDLYKLKAGQTIHFTLTNNPGKEYDADVYAISNTFEPNTKAIAVHATVKGDKQGLIDGMSITALVSLENATVDAVPTQAIVSNKGQDFIFIVVDDGHDENNPAPDHNHKNEVQHEGNLTFEKIPVKTGTTDVGYSEITMLSDVPSGSRIVTHGAFFILAKMINQGEAHEH